MGGTRGGEGEVEADFLSTFQKERLLQGGAQPLSVAHKNALIHCEGGEVRAREGGIRVGEEGVQGLVQANVLERRGNDDGDGGGGRRQGGEREGNA